jgi:hypothetical protein
MHLRAGCAEITEAKSAKIRFAMTNAAQTRATI